MHCNSVAANGFNRVSTIRCSHETLVLPEQSADLIKVLVAHNVVFAVQPPPQPSTFGACLLRSYTVRKAAYPGMHAQKTPVPSHAPPLFHQREFLVFAFPCQCGHHCTRSLLSASRSFPKFKTPESSTLV